MTRPQPRVQAVVGWCPTCVTSAPSSADPHIWAAAHLHDNGHRTLVRQRLLFVYDPESKDQ